MKIDAIKYGNTNFCGATLNINAFSDTHGQLSEFGNFWSEIEKNKDDIFLKEGPGKKDVIAIAGDWFMAGNVKGYKSRPDFNSQKFQLVFFNRFMQKISQMSKSATAIFTPGNHEFDAGAEEFALSVSKMRAHVIGTNIDIENSPLFKNKITKSKIIEIKDDKDPNLYHKALFVGVSPGNMSYYNKKLTGIKFLDDVYKPQTKITPEEIQNSLTAIKDEIEQFKKQNPQGAVVLLDHFGGTFEREIIKQNPPINVILGAHEHLDYEKYSGSVLTAKLFQNFKKFENVKIKFDDNGSIKEIRSKAYYPTKSAQKNQMHEFYERIFKKDIETKYEIPAPDDIQELSLKGIRFENSPLANFITDVILYRIKKIYPDTDFFALNASAIRGPLNTKNAGTINNTDLLLTLNGIKQEDADILISQITGDELVEIVCENIASNKEDQTRNPLMHYSGLKINRSMLIKGMEKGLRKEYLRDFITRADTDEPIELDKTYKIANVEKFFIKSKYPPIKELYISTSTTKTRLNAKEEFRNYFNSGDNEVAASNEKRIS